jgi:hypothetical protein
MSRRALSARPARRAGRAFFLALLIAAAPVAAGPVHEPHPAAPAAESPPPPTRRLGRRAPRVAIIIDDIGYDAALARDFLALEIPLTFSLLPDGPHRQRLARQAADAGVELMLHLPMEPLEYPDVSPGPNALMARLSGDALADRIDAALSRLPEVKGVNNHMGSRLTGMAAPIHRVLALLRDQDLYFVDSVTNPQSLCRPVARRLQVPFARRDVFLDHDLRPAAIRRQIDRLIQVARSHGKAVGIGHPHAATRDALRDARPRLMEAVQLVPASRIVETAG